MALNGLVACLPHSETSAFPQAPKRQEVSLQPHCLEQTLSLATSGRDSHASRLAAGPANAICFA